MKKILFILGTRPEAIKLKPLVENSIEFFDIKICLTNQHENLQIFFENISEKIINLDLKREEKSLCGLMGNILKLLDQNEKIRLWKPDLIIVHGDTCSALCGALYAFYEQIKLCHIEAGLRTNDKMSPFPEECNRKFIDYLSDFHFAPTFYNQQNLIKEGVENSVYVVGNTIMDVLNQNKPLLKQKKENYGLVTLHRRENWEFVIEKSLIEISKFALEFKYKIFYVLNKNELLKNKIKEIKNEYFQSIESMDTVEFHNLLNGANFVITDSGGIQEEAACLGKPLLIMRSKTEREEIIKNGCGYLVDPNNIFDILYKLINNNIKFNYIKNLYGEGSTSKKIVNILYENILYKS